MLFSQNPTPGELIDAISANTAQLATLSRPNLLDNWYFAAANVIDQRGGYVVPPGTAYYSNTGLTTSAGTVSAYTKATYLNATYGTIAVGSTTYYVAFSAMVRGYTGNGYTVDKVANRSYEGTLLVTPEGIRLIGGSGAVFFTFPIESLPSDTVYTASVLAKNPESTGEVHLRANQFQNTANAWIPSSDDFEITTLTFIQPNYIADASPNVCIRLSANAEILIKAIKLELGDTQTLARQDADGNWVLNDPPPNSALELAKCQRYQIMGPMTAPYITSPTDNHLLCFLPIPVTLRSTPAKIGTLTAHTVNANKTVSGATVAFHSVVRNGVYLVVTNVSEPAYVYFNSSAGLDANL